LESFAKYPLYLAVGDYVSKLRMKKKIVFLFFVPLIYLHGQINVDTGFSVQQLVEDVLVNSDCAETSNYSSFTGTEFGFNGIGYFNANDSSFQFQEGIILSTGNARDAVGPNVNIVSSGVDAWEGDDDISRVTQTGALFNATYIQFDFVPTTNQLSFNFLFASEEYSDEFQCTFSDVFAFILTDPQGNTTNLAIIPGTDDPVRVTTVRPGVPNLCNAENSEFFDQINNATDAAISFTGQTKRLQAMSDVIPGESYTIKLAIADNLDSQLDSAVFLEAGSFSIDLSLGENRTVEGGNPLCNGEEIVLDASAPGVVGYTWFRDEVVLPQFQDQSIITVSEGGDYRVEIAFSSICVSEGEITLEFIEPPQVQAPPDDIILCDLDGDGVEIFDFTLNAEQILGTQDPSIYQVTFYMNLSDAENFVNSIRQFASYTNNSETETIYARISSGRSCFEIVPFQITVQTLDLAIALEEEFILCLDELGRPKNPLPQLNTGLSEAIYRFTWYRDSISEQNRIVGETSAVLVATVVGTYVVEVQHRIFGCTFSLQTEVNPIAPPTRFEVVMENELFVGTNTVRIIAEGDSEYLFSIDDGPFVPENLFENLLGGDHIAQIMDINGCTTLSLPFEIIDYPRFFTPNGDGVNDAWGVIGGNSLENAEITIYDRFGRLLRQQMADEFWDGNFSGIQMPSSDYWFRIAYQRDNEQRVFRGHFSLKR